MEGSEKHLVLLVAGLIAVVGIAAGCSSDSDSGNGAAHKGVPFKETVTITKSGFHPAHAHVLVGGSITWINHDPDQVHTAETPKGAHKHIPGGQDASFDTHTLSWGEPYTVTFHVPGMYGYGSSYDLWKATVEVSERKKPSR